MKYLVVALLAFVALASAVPLSEEENQFLFVAWAKQHDKVYTHDEFFTRYSIFKSNLDLIRKHNAGSHSYTLAMNKFGDMTREEFKGKMTGYKRTDLTQFRSVNSIEANVTVPAAVDWRKKNAVTGVKDQGQCGSCWSFSATGSMEGAWAIAKGKLVSLSEQQLVDCSTAQGNQGCNGGLMDYAFQYVISNKGICSEQSYPYTATGPNTCQTSCSSVASISSFNDVPANDNDNLLASVAKGPVSVAIEADQSVFQFYSSGVLDDASCGTQLDHGVLAVGYDHDASSGKDYWIVKNSWGGSWGNQGYVWIRRDKGSSPGICGIAMEASYPVV